jgi:putative spermidine/putrescine transport system permease protein
MTFSLRSPLGIVLSALVGIAFVLLILPIVVIVVAPLGETGYLAFPPHGLTLRWYEAAVNDGRYLDGLYRSAIIGIMASVISTSVGILSAYALTRRRFIGRGTLETLFLSPLILPTLVLAVALSLFFSRLGLPPSIGRLVGAHVVVCIPYVIRVSLPVLRRFDRTLEEAAQNLGASPLATFFLVLLPVIRPAIVAGAVMAFITSFDEVVLALFLANPGEPTLPVMIYSAVQLGFEPPVAAVSGLLVLATAVLMVIYQRFGHSRID